MSGLADRAEIFVEVLRTNGLELSASSPHQLAGPRGASFPVNLTNLGNHFETFELSASGLPDGWAALHPSRLSLGAFETGSFQLSLFPPRTALAGDYGLGLSARGLEGECFEEVELRATVEPTASLSLSCLETHLSVAQGSDITYALHLTSESNFDESVALDVEGLPEGWGWFLGSEDSPLPAFTSREVNITVRVPQPCAAGVYRFCLKAATESWSAEQRVTAEVLPSRSFVALLDRSQERLSPGASAAFDITIKNTGNCRDTYVLSLEDGAVAQFSRNYISAPPGSTEHIGLTVSVQDGERSGERAIVVNVASSLDPTLTKSLLIRVLVERVSRLALEFGEASTVDAGARGSFSIIVRNLGPDEENISLTPLFRPGWELELESVTVPPGSIREVRVGFVIPPDAPSGVFGISLLASSGLQSWTIVHNVTVLGASPPPDAEAPPYSGSHSTGSTLLPATIAAALMVALAIGLLVIWALSRRRG